MNESQQASGAWSFFEWWVVVCLWWANCTRTQVIVVPWITRHLLAKLEKSGLGSKWVCRSMFNDNSLDHSFQKFRTHILVDVASVESYSDFIKVENCDSHDFQAS